ncbi:MAG: hypothetical protein DLM54_03995 [Acidimicrobiales bacterium]|nr:MAG: hypothetical protein DLM54_03995 [Acidimicrobiales bacterium]
MGLATLGVGIGAAPAFAATNGTSQATAQAIGGNLINTGTCKASNDGTTGSNSGPCTNTGPTITNPNGQLITASVLTQAAVAASDGSSAACAGASGTGGGGVQVGPNLQCMFNTSATGGGGINLLGGLLTANAVFATCTDTAAGPPMGKSTLANLALGSGSGLLGLGNILSGTLPTGANQSTIISVLGPLNVNLGQLLKITTDTETTNANGTLRVTALRVQVLGTSTLLGSLGLGNLSNGLVITVGNVTCGPNATVAGMTPMFPAKGLPIAGGVLALAGGAAYLGRRRLMGVRA